MSRDRSEPKASHGKQVVGRSVQRIVRLLESFFWDRITNLDTQVYRWRKDGKHKWAWQSINAPLRKWRSLLIRAWYPFSNLLQTDWMANKSNPRLGQQ